MKKILIVLLAIVSTFSSCKTLKKASNEDINTLDEIKVVGKKLEYKGSALQVFDLIHTKLDVSFSWEDQYLFGIATLTLKPYFYDNNVLELDAKAMEIKQVALRSEDGSLKDLKYSYDNKVIKISLDKMYNRNETFDIYIKYISKPNEIEKAEGLRAISDDKGLYFINPLGEDKDKPGQIWTQGEPESNSVWFPTIDKPNERCTQEIAITIENNFIAMSNGYIANNVDNGDGTYTITWKQDRPHAPYLFMMTIGEFAEVKDSWRGMSVNYYVEDEYKDVAKEIFGKTPEMLTYFSDVLGVPYQWDKYWQVIVRDYVSGAMENTSAVIFGEFVQRDKRELLDENHEDIVAHELFHHWFGDLVTCESWANLPLNESFATYGEVMWKEYKYGIDEKYLKVKQDMDSYFREAKNGKQVDMIRFHYDAPEDMFDSHSYAKGGVILNMLRGIVGDDAFYSSLQHYLWYNKYQSVEIHDLRIAFEKVTGQDLNWFFNQWFLSAGHPIIDVNYVYTDSSVIVKLKQEPSKEDYLVYILPMAIDITEGYNTRRENIIFDKKKQEFEFMTSVKPQLVNIDADKMLLAKFNDNKTEENYIVQFDNATNLIDKVEALNYFAGIETKSVAVNKAIAKALDDDFWYVKQQALKKMEIDKMNATTISKIEQIAQNATKTELRATAIKTLADLKNKKHEVIFENGVNAESYRVNAASLEALLEVNPKRALEVAETMEEVSSFEVIDAVGLTYSKKGDASKKVYFKNLATNADNVYKKYYAIYHYSKFLGNQEKETVLDGISFIEDWGLTTEGDYIKRVATSALTRISNAYVIKADSYKNEIKNATGLTQGQVTVMENEYAEMLLILERIEESSANLK